MKTENNRQGSEISHYWKRQWWFTIVTITTINKIHFLKFYLYHIQNKGNENTKIRPKGDVNLLNLLANVRTHFEHISAHCLKIQNSFQHTDVHFLSRDHCYHNILLHSDAYLPGKNQARFKDFKSITKWFNLNKPIKM